MKNFNPSSFSMVVLKEKNNLEVKQTNHTKNKFKCQLVVPKQAPSDELNSKNNDPIFMVNDDGGFL